MPIFHCYRGDAEGLSFLAEGRTPVVCRDALGRQWLCVESNLQDMPQHALPDTMFEMLMHQWLMRKMGAQGEGAGVMLLDCPDENALRRQVIVSTYPLWADSAARLARAGWGMSQSSFATGEPTRLTISNGRFVVSVEGENDDEAWYIAARRLLGPISTAQENPTMNLIIHADTVPLRVDEYGAVRVGASRVLLDVVLGEFKTGASADAIADAYSTLELADVYGVIAYYLKHKAEVDAWLDAQDEAAEQLRAKIEAKQPDRGTLREKLLARRAEMEQEHAATPR